MRIIFGVAGEGYGHATRSKPVIDYLKKHEVKILGGGKAAKYFANYYNFEKIACLNIVYVKNSVSNILTSLLNIVKIPFYFYSFIKTILIFAKFKPDLVINDFEPFTNWVAIIFRTPVINIDNESLINKTNLKIPKKYFLSYLKTYLILELINPKNTFGIISSFYPFEPKKNNVIAFPPLRKEIKNLTVSEGNYILVYQTSKSYKNLLNILKKVNKNFVIYGFEKDEKFDNLTFKKFNEKGFFKDLANCKAVITNGGFSLICEALFLKKPILSCPVKKQIEQEINSYYLEKTGCGKSVEEITKENVEFFVENFVSYKEQLKHFKWEENFYEKLKKVLKKIKR